MPGSKTLCRGHALIENTDIDRDFGRSLRAKTQAHRVEHPSQPLEKPRSCDDRVKWPV